MKKVRRAYAEKGRRLVQLCCSGNGYPVLSAPSRKQKKPLQHARHPGKRTMKSFLVFLFMGLLIQGAPGYAAAPAPPAAVQPPVQEAPEPVWEEMPVGARTAYIGIHGGTVPVSLLTAGDGSPMIAVVGLTGNDFLNFIRSKGKLEEELVLSDAPASTDTTPLYPPTPKVLPPRRMPAHIMIPEVEARALRMAKMSRMEAQQNAQKEAARLAPKNAPTLSVNSAAQTEEDIPVIYSTGTAFEKMSLIPRNWAPFGLTETALPLEGKINILSTPKAMPKTGKKRP